MEIQSETINELAKALAVAQGAIAAAQKDGTNPHYKSAYATLDSIWQACRKSLSSNGLSVVQLPMSDENGLYLITILAHQSGQWIRSNLRIKPVGDTPQAVGSALTYGRRYALAAIVGVAPADEDDDGEGASTRQQTQPAQPRPQPKPEKVNGQPAGNVPTKPEDLLALINKRVEATYENVPHLHNAIQVELGGRWRWPDADNVEGWREAYKVAKSHADKKVQTPAPAEQPVAPEDEFAF